MSPSPNTPTPEEFMSGLPEDLPDVAWNARLGHYFDQYIAPSAIQQGHDIHSMKEAFKQAVGRPGRTEWPRANVAASNFVSSLLNPVLGMSGDPEALDVKHQLESDTARSEMVAQRQGAFNQYPIIGNPAATAGGMLGALPYFAAMGPAEAGITKLGVPMLERMSLSTLAGSTLSAAYDAAKADPGERMKAAQAGFSNPWNMLFAIGGIKSKIAESHPYLGNDGINNIYDALKGNASEEAGMQAGAAVQLDPSIYDTIGNAVKQSADTARKQGVPYTAPTIEGGEPLTIDQTLSDQQRFTASIVNNDNIPQVIEKSAEHWDLGGNVNALSGDAKAIRDAGVAVDNVRQKAGDFDIGIEHLISEGPQVKIRPEVAPSEVGERPKAVLPPAINPDIPPDIASEAIKNLGNSQAEYAQTLAEYGMKPIKSSALRAAGYDPETKTLSVLAKQGTLYQHYPVESEEYAEWMGSKSLGSAYNKMFGKGGPKWRSLSQRPIDIPIMDKLKELPNGMVLNKETNETFSSYAEALSKRGADLKYSADTPNSVGNELTNNADADTPLTPRGISDAESIGRKLVGQGFGSGHYDVIIPSDSDTRIQQMSDVLHSTTGALRRSQTAGLETWAQGGLQGLDRADAELHISRLVREAPDEAPIGLGPQSSRPGESFSSVVDRTRSNISSLVNQQDATGGGRYVVPTHSTVLNIAKAMDWDSGKVDPDLYLTSESGAPGSMYRVEVDPMTNRIKGLAEVDINQPNSIDQDGVYLLRHTETGVTQGAPGTIGSRDVSPYQSTSLAHQFQGPKGASALGLPSNVAGTVQPSVGGGRPVMYLGSANPGVASEEIAHAAIANLGLEDNLRQLVGDSPTARALRGRLTNSHPSIYDSGNEHEEAFVKSMRAFLNDETDQIDAMAAADTDRETVANWTHQTARQFLQHVSGEDDNVAQRILQRQLSATIKRTGGLAADFEAKRFGADIRYSDGKFTLTEPDGTERTFASRSDLANFSDKKYSEPASAPELVDGRALPAGVPRFAVNDYNPGRTPTGTPPNDVMRSTAEFPEGYTPPKKSIMSFSWNLRPTLNWFDDADKRAGLGGRLFNLAFNVKNAETVYNKAAAPYRTLIKDIVGPLLKLPYERGVDLHNYALEDDPAARLKMRTDLNMTDQMVAAAERLRSEVIDPINQLAAAHGMEEGYKGFVTGAKQQLKVNRSFGLPRPGDSWDAPEHELAWWGRLANDGELDYRDQNLYRQLPHYIEQVHRKIYMEKPLRELAHFGNTAMNVEGGGFQYALGEIQPIVKRYVEDMRGTPDKSMAVVQGVINSANDLYNWGINKVNKLLPAEHQIPEVGEDIDEDGLGRFLGYQYQYGLAFRPGLSLRHAAQVFTTLGPVLNQTYINEGLRQAFGAGKAAAHDLAERFGALLTDRDFKQTISSAELGLDTKIGRMAQTSIKWSRASANGVRLVGFMGFRQKVLDALAEHGSRGDWDAFSQKADFSMLSGDNMRRMFLNEAKGLPDLSGTAAQDFASNVARELTDQCLWSYSKAGGIGYNKYAIGRVLGQYGIWPLSYVEYARKLATNGTMAERAARLTRLAVYHGAILAAGNAVGIDTSHWVFTNPMAFTGSPMMEAMTQAPQMFDFSSPKGAEARREMMNPLWWWEVPGGLEAEKLVHSMMTGDPHDIAVTGAGLTPVRKGHYWLSN